jgi:hypothetical protein
VKRTAWRHAGGFVSRKRTVVAPVVIASRIIADQNGVASLNHEMRCGSASFPPTSGPTIYAELALK